MGDGNQSVRAVEQAVLKSLGEGGWCDPCYWTIAQVAERAGVPWEFCRAALRSLTCQGLARYASGLFNEDGQVWGSGYAITQAGCAALKEIE